MKLRAYELLYRDGKSDRAVFADGDSATYHVVARTLLDMGLDRLVGSATAFVNATAGFLADGGYRLLPPGRTVVGVTGRVAGGLPRCGRVGGRAERRGTAPVLRALARPAPSSGSPVSPAVPAQEGKRAQV